MSNFWQIMTGTAPVQTVTTANGTQLQGGAGVLYKLFGPASSNSSRSEVNRNIVEALNRGLHLSRKDKKALRRLAAHGNEWFNEDGNLKEGLSRRLANRATKAKSRVGAYAAEIMPKDALWAVPMELKQARWALDNFARNGYDTEAAALYAKINNYTDLAGLWGGDVAATLKGGRYGQNAATAEAAYYNSLSAPQKRAYLRQRAEWAKSGLISPASGVSLNNLGTVSEADMRNYAALNISTWQNSFYGNNGYQDEYTAAHPATSSSDGALYQLYGLTPSNNGAVSWLPSGSEVRTSFPGVTPLPPISTGATKKSSRVTGSTTKKSSAIPAEKKKQLTDKNIAVSSYVSKGGNNKIVYIAKVGNSDIYITHTGLYVDAKGNPVDKDGQTSEWTHYDKNNAAETAAYKAALDKAKEHLKTNSDDVYSVEEERVSKNKKGGTLRYFR